MDPVPPPPYAASAVPALTDGQPSSAITQSDLKNWALAAHLSSFSGYIGVPLGHVLGPLIVYLMKKGQNPWLDEHMKESLNYNLSWLLYFALGAVVGVVLFFATLGLAMFLMIPLAVLYAVAWIIFPILAAVKASNFEGYRYPLTIRFIN